MAYTCSMHVMTPTTTRTLFVKATKEADALRFAAELLAERGQTVDLIRAEATGSFVGRTPELQLWRVEYR